MQPNNEKGPRRDTEREFGRMSILAHVGRPRIFLAVQIMHCLQLRPQLPMELILASDLFAKNSDKGYGVNARIRMASGETSKNVLENPRTVNRSESLENCKLNPVSIERRFRADAGKCPSVYEGPEILNERATFS
jgi:hypothetical protein